jgi:hypothetical protein
VPLTLLLLAAGCGGARHVAVRQAPVRNPRTCTMSAPGFRTCSAVMPSNATIERRTTSGWKVLTGPLKPQDPAAEWGEVSLSPDGRTLLAAYEYPCDSAVVVFVPAAGGTPRVVTGEADWRRAPVAHASVGRATAEHEFRSTSRGMATGSTRGIRVCSCSTLASEGSTHSPPRAAVASQRSRREKPITATAPTISR